MAASKILAFHTKQAKELLLSCKLTADLSLDLNESSKSPIEYVLFQHYVISKYANEKAPFVDITRCDLDLNENTKNLVILLHDFINSDKTTAFIIIDIYTQAGLGHCVYLYAEKKDSDTMMLEYIDPYGTVSPYGNPPKKLNDAISAILINSTYNKFFIIGSSDKQQNTTKSCFVITYQNMLDKLENRTQKTIRTIKNNSMDYDSITAIREKMQKDIKWLSIKYEEALKAARDHAEKLYPEMADERRIAKENYNNAKEHSFDLYYDPEKYGHGDLIKAEIDKCAELLANIDFSQAPSQACAMIVQSSPTSSGSQLGFWSVTTPGFGSPPTEFSDKATFSLQKP